MSKQCGNCGAQLPEAASFCPHCAQSQIERKEAKPPAFFGAIYRKKEGLLCFRLIDFEDFPQYAIPPWRISARRCWKKPFPAIPR